MRWEEDILRVSNFHCGETSQDHGDSDIWSQFLKESLDWSPVFLPGYIDFLDSKKWAKLPPG